MTTKMAEERATSFPKSQRMTARPAAAPRRSAPSRDQIAARAKAIWQKKGCPAGQDERNWLEAEAQLKAEAGNS